MKKKVIALGLLISVVACSPDGEDASMDDGDRAETGMTDVAEASGTPEMIVAERGGFIPEGIEYDNMNGRFLTGSLAEGSIFEIASDGSVREFVTDAELVSSVGIEVDEERNRILAANSDRAVFDGSSSGHAMLGVYDLSSGQRIVMVDLGAAIVDAPDGVAHFANDVAVGPDGTAYVTDSRAGVIYSVSPDYVASVFYDPQLDDPGFNGIEVHPGGYLLVAGGTTLRKVPLDDPSGAFAVALPEDIPGQDGIVWLGPDRLAVVSNSSNRVVILTSADEWATAEVEASGSYDIQATTAAVVNGEVYVVHPHFADADPPSISRVVFP